MKKIGLCLLAAMLCFAIVTTTDAQGVKTGDKAFSAKEISITGGLDLCYGYLNSGITSILNFESEGEQGAGTGVSQDNSVFMLVPQLTINFDIDVGDKVTAFVQLENRRLVSEPTWIDLTGDVNVDTLFPMGGTAANVDVASGDNIEPAVEQAYIKVSEFLLPELTFTIGIQDLKFTLRKGEGAFFMDIAESEAMAPQFLKDSASLNLANVDEWFIVGEGAPFLRDVSEFGGMVFDYGDMEKNNYALCVFYGSVNETGVARTDENLFGLQLDYALPGENNVLKAILANTTSHGRKIVGQDVIDMNIMTLGVGVDYWVQPDIEVYAEFYTQSGDYGHFWKALPAPGAHDAVDQKASAYRLGGRYNLEHDLKPYVDLSMWNLSGDNGEIDSDNEDFISYENVQSTLIMEGNLLGLDLDSNYNAIKLEAGITTQFDINKDGTGEEVTIKLLYGTFSLTEKPEKVGRIATQVDRLGIDDALGSEIDIVATLKYSDSLSFTFGIGMVSGADFFEGEDTLDGGPLDSIKDSAYAMDDAGMTLVMFDTRLSF